MKYYRIYANAGVVYVKEEGYFRSQNGTNERLGKAWKRVRAESIEHARKVGAMNDMAHCAKCGQDFATSFFYRSTKATSGLSSWCKACTGKRVRKITPARRASNVKKQRRYENRHPERQRARKALKRAVASGAIKRQPCEVCGNIKTQGHHDDYSKPLEVRWLCHPHHVEVHTGRLPMEKFL